MLSEVTSQARTSCHEAITQAPAEQTLEPAAAEVETPSTPATLSTPAPAPVAIAPTATPGKQRTAQPWRQWTGTCSADRTLSLLNLSLVAVKRITSDIPASNFDQFELEIAGELSLAIGGFVIPRRAGARQ